MLLFTDCYIPPIKRLNPDEIPFSFKRHRKFPQFAQTHSFDRRIESLN